ncbi:MAG: hypothetical protein ACYDIC_08030 [Desulfobaccales bacterium]
MRDFGKRRVDQICTALIAYLLMLWIKLRSRLVWSILEFPRLVQDLINGTIYLAGFALPTNL